MTSVNTNTNTPIFRFKFSNEFIEQLTPFAKLHQYSDRHVYKEEWTRWVANNDELICNEGLRLKHVGYDGNIHDKMYKSGRYYFRNKTNKDVQTRRKYISLEHEIIVAMDEHISANFHVVPKFKPSSGYEQFYLDCGTLLNNELDRLVDDIRKEDIWSKFKKTYKNRYYLFQKNYSNRVDRLDDRSDQCMDQCMDQVDQIDQVNNINKEND